MKRKILTAVTAITLSFILAACGSSAAQGSNNHSSPDQDAQQSEDAASSQTENPGADKSGPAEDTAKRVARDGAEIQTEDPAMPTRVPMEGGTKINMYFGDTLIPGVLNDSETARALIEKLPYTQHVSRYSHDFCGVTEDLPYREEEVHYGWLNGDIDFAIDAPYFTILFEDEDVSEQYGYQVNIGVITCPLSEIAALEGSYDVRIELAEDSEQTEEGNTVAPADALQTENGATASSPDAQQTKEGAAASYADALQTDEGATASSGDAQQTDEGAAASSGDAQQAEEAIAEPEAAISNTKEAKMLRMMIGETPVEVNWEENSAVESLKDLCREEPLQIQLSMYGGFEQVGSIGQNLPTDDQQTTTRSGDIVLYSGNQIVVFYGSNSWAYTRLGHISDKTDQEMTELLGNGDVTITLTNN